MPFLFEDSLGVSPIVYRTDDDRLQSQFAAGSRSRRVFDAFEEARTSLWRRSVVCVDQIDGPASTSLTITSSPSESSSLEGEVRGEKLSGPADHCSVSCDIGPSRTDWHRGGCPRVDIASWDFARDDIEPNLELCPSSLVWSGRTDLPQNAEVSGVYTYNSAKESGGALHGATLHAKVEPVGNITRLEWDFDVREKELESSVELGPRAGPSCRLELCGRSIRRGVLKTAAHQDRVSTLTYTRDVCDGKETFKAELMKRKKTRKSVKTPSREESAVERVSPPLASSSPASTASNMPLSKWTVPSFLARSPGVTLKMKKKNDGRGVRLHQFGLTHWISSDKHISFKTTLQDKASIEMGSGRVSCRAAVAGGRLGSIMFKRQGDVSSELSWTREKQRNRAKLTLKGNTPLERVTVRVSVSSSWGGQVISSGIDVPAQRNGNEKRDMAVSFGAFVEL
jgi:hypothetical protein